MAKIGSALLGELSFQPGKVFYHTDSTSVLYFLTSPQKRFPVFVGNRIQQVLDLSSPSQWRYVLSEDDPVDCASRGLTKLQVASLWFNAPQYLKEEECRWLQSPCVSKKTVVQCETFAVDAEETKICRHKDEFGSLISHYSDWVKLKRAVAVFLRVLEIIRRRSSSKGLA